MLDETAAVPGGTPERPAIAGPGAGPLSFIELICATAVAGTVATGTVGAAGCAVGAVRAADVAAAGGAAVVATAGAWEADDGALGVAAAEAAVAVAAGFVEGAEVDSLATLAALRMDSSVSPVAIRASAMRVGSNFPCGWCRLDRTALVRACLALALSAALEFDAAGAGAAAVGAAAAAGAGAGAAVPWPAPCPEEAVEGIFFAGADGFLLSSSISRFLLRARSLRESGLSTSSPSFLYLLWEKLTESLNSFDAGV